LVQWYIPVIPATRGSRRGGLWFEARPDKKLVRPPFQLIS
jgi:hypothetical protein